MIAMRSFGLSVRERGQVPLRALLQDQLLERRVAVVVQLIRQFLADASTGDAPDLVANAVAHRLAQVLLHAVDRAVLEVVDARERAQHGVLYHVLGVRAGTRIVRQPSARPAAQRTDRPLDQHPGRRIRRPWRARSSTSSVESNSVASSDGAGSDWFLVGLLELHGHGCSFLGKAERILTQSVSVRQRHIVSYEELVRSSLDVPAPTI